MRRAKKKYFDAYVRGTKSLRFMYGYNDQSLIWFSGVGRAHTAICAPFTAGGKFTLRPTVFLCKRSYNIKYLKFSDMIVQKNKISIRVYSEGASSVFFNKLKSGHAGMNK